MATVLNDRRAAPPSGRLVTGEELLQHPEWGPCELIRGKVVPVCRPNSEHGVLMTELAARLWNHVKDKKLGKVFSGDSGVYLERNPDTVRGPDVFYLRAERLPDGRVPEQYMEVAPDLCVEIISPNDTWSDMNEKVDMYFAAGVALVWVIDPRTRKAHVYKHGRDARIIPSGGALSGEDILPNFTLKLEDLFAALD